MLLLFQFLTSTEPMWCARMGNGRMIMNKQRRKQLEKVQGAIFDAIANLEWIRDEEQEAFDNLPESLQYSEKGEYMEETIGMIEDVLSDLESIDMEELCNR